MVIPSLVRQALTGSEMTVYGDGAQARCFTHVGDAVRALIALAEHPETTGEIYNIGSAEEISILELAHKIKKMTGSSSRIVMVPYEQAYEQGFEDMMRRLPDLTKAFRTIGYQPSFNLDRILQDTIKYHIGDLAGARNQEHQKKLHAV